MATKQELDDAIDGLLAAEAARDAVVTAALTDLEAKVVAGQLPPEDFAAEIVKIKTLQANAASLTQTATAADPGPTTVPATPIDTGTVNDSGSGQVAAGSGAAAGSGGATGGEPVAGDGTVVE